MLNKLRAFCDTKGLRHPNYDYIDTENMGEYYVIIYLPTGQIVRGERCDGRRNALEVASFKALQIMRSCPEATEYQGPPPTQFVPLQVTEILTPRKTPNLEDSLDSTLSVPPPLGGPTVGNVPLGGLIPNQSLFDGQSILRAALGIHQPFQAADQDGLPPTMRADHFALQDEATEAQLLGNLLSGPQSLPEVVPEPKPVGKETSRSKPQDQIPQAQPAYPPMLDKELTESRPGSEESPGKSPVPRPGGARTRVRRQGAKGGAKLAINFGGSG